MSAWIVMLILFEALTRASDCGTLVRVPPVHREFVSQYFEGPDNE